MDHIMKLFIGTYGKHWYSVDYSNNEFSNLERFEGQDHSCICVKDGIPYSISENTEAGPCYLTPVKGTDLFISSNFGDGSVDLIRFVKECSSEREGLVPHFLQKLQFIGDGPVKERGRQIHSRIHQVLEFPLKGIFPDTDGAYFIATDFGADRIRVLKLLSDKLVHCSELDIHAPAGSGPRHLAFNAKERLMYCLCELSNELLVFRFNKNGAEIVQRIDTSILGISGAPAERPAAGDLKIHPDGKFLYATRRLVNDGILVFKINGNGLLEFSSFKASEKHPRMICISSSGNPEGESQEGDNIMFAACKDSGIQVFSLCSSQGSGYIGKQTAGLTLPEEDSPVWVQPAEISAEQFRAHS